jgi:hypothetical protein
LRKKCTCDLDNAANALLTGMKKVSGRIRFSSWLSAAALIAELNTESRGLLATAVAARWPVSDPKLPAPRRGMNPQLVPTCTVLDGGPAGTGGAPVALAGAGGEVPQPAATTVSSAAIKATPKEA